MTVLTAGPLTARTVAIDDPRDLLAHLARPASVAWVRRGEGLVGWGEAARIDAGRGSRRFERAAASLADVFSYAAVSDEVAVPGTGPVAFGTFSFDPRRGGSVLVVPRVVLGRRDGHAWLTVIGDDEVGSPRGQLQALPAPGRVRYSGATMSEVRWLEAVDSATRAIHRGELAKVVLARDLLVWADDVLDPRVLARRLAERFADCFTFVCDGLVGATPELLARRFGERVESIVLAGSAARGRDAEQDTGLGAGLLASGKDRREHDLAVASVRSVLERRCERLDVDGEPSLLRLSNVQHLATAARGTLRATRAGGAVAAPGGWPSALTLAAALHPTAAVCGTPTATALQLIRTLEGMDRARYSGPVGWVDGRGDGEWGIALRCAEVDGNRARLFAGAGIVGDSLPEAELEETRLKLRAMQSALEA